MSEMRAQQPCSPARRRRLEQAASATDPSGAGFMEKLLTAEAVAEILNVSTAWVYDHADRKRPLITSVRLGKALRFQPDHVRKFIDDMTRRIA